MRVQQFIIRPELEEKLREFIQKKGDISKIINAALERYLDVLEKPLTKEEKIFLEALAEDLYKQYGILEEQIVKTTIEEKYRNWTYGKIMEATKFICNLIRKN